MYSEHYAQKICRIQNIEDLFSNLLVYSDLYNTDISRKHYEKYLKINEYPRELQYLLDMEM